MMDWGLVLVGVVIVVGILQWMKTFIKNWPSWAWSITNAGAALLAAITVYFLPVWVNLWLVIWAVSQLGYENVIQLVKRFIDNLKAGKKE